MGFLAGEATQGELQGELLTRQFRSENETSTRSFPRTNVHCVVVSFPGTKLHGNEIIQCCQRGQLHCAMGGGRTATMGLRSGQHFGSRNPGIERLPLSGF